MSAAVMEPQWLRGGWGTVVNRPGCYWFDTGAWSKAGGCLQLLITRWGGLLWGYACMSILHMWLLFQNSSIF